MKKSLIAKIVSIFSIAYGGIVIIGLLTSQHDSPFMFILNLVLFGLLVAAGIVATTFLFAKTKRSEKPWMIVQFVTFCVILLFYIVDFVQLMGLVGDPAYNQASVSSGLGLTFAKIGLFVTSIVFSIIYLAKKEEISFAGEENHQDVIENSNTSETKKVNQDVTKKITELKDLLDKGLISEAQYNEAVTKLLNSAF